MAEGLDILDLVLPFASYLFVGALSLYLLLRPEAGQAFPGRPVEESTVRVFAAVLLIAALVGILVRSAVLFDLVG